MTESLKTKAVAQKHILKIEYVDRRNRKRPKFHLFSACSVKFHVNLTINQGWIQDKFEGGAVGSWGAENFSEFGDESTLYTTISDPNY